ncbi:MAG: SAM-dependent methyltransferase, partial [Marinilabiliales bacterium]
KLLPYGNKGEGNRLCPKCLSLERHRLLWMFLKNKTEFFHKNYQVLHIAPEQPFVQRFRNLANLKYTTADLESPLADIKLDIREMPIKDCSYDVVICNHVLEHIDNEEKALSEVYRVLELNGWAILQVPIDYSRETTFEDSSITDREEREKIFGQYDHVRVHGRDYPKRLEKAGFKVSVENYLDTFSEKDKDLLRLQKEEIIYVCKKTEC